MGLADIILGVGRTNITKTTQITDIITFVEQPWGLNMRLFPVQKVILKAHYGIPLDDVEVFQISDWHRKVFTDHTEKSYLEYLYKDGRSNISEVVPGKERRELVLSIGRRSGKTFLAACISAYETYKLLLKGNPQAHYGLPASNNIQIISVATDKEQAGILYQEVSGHYRGCGFFGAYTANNTQSFARFQTPYDIEKYGRYAEDPTAKATIKVTFRSCIAKGLRGPGNMVIILDEMAHFTDAGQSSADAVYTALAPSASAFSPKDPTDPRKPIGDVEGRIISISSPLGKQGMFYKLFQIGMKGGEAGDNFLCIQAPTWEVNPTIPASRFASEFAKDATVFYTEYGARFTDRTRGWIENDSDLFSCIDTTLKMQGQGVPRRAHFIGVDVGLVNDGSAAAIGHIENNQIVLDYIDQIKAGEGRYFNLNRLEFEGVADWVYDLSRKFYIADGMFDTWAGIPFEQALNKRGLSQIHVEQMTPQLKSDIFKNFKDMMWSRRLRLFDHPVEPGKEHADYLLELMELQAEYHTKYRIDVFAPEMDGKHDDRSDALVRMVWKASQRLSNMGYIAKGNPLGLRQPNAPPAPRMPPPSAIRASRRMGSSPERQVRAGNGRGRMISRGFGR